MKKEVAAGLLFIFLTLIFLSFMQAQTTLVNETAKIDEAYSCLEDKVVGKCSTLSTEEKAFSLLAVSQCRAELISDSQNNGECWPSGNCRIKTTAQAILALDNANQQTSAAQNWLLSQNKSTTELIWYLQVENPDGATACTVNYGASSYTFSVGDDKKISDDAGPCLIRAQDNYWFGISPNCYNQEFQTSCDKDFSTTLLFSKTGSSTIHVSSATHSASSGSGSQGTTTEKVESFCFAENNFCNYEGSLWAALVLNSLDKEVSSYLPYLITLAEDNPRFLPDAFLYFITSDDNFRASLLSKQRSNKWWSESGDRYYDTALAIYPFQSQTFTEKTNAKQWLLESQDANGCWQDNTRNTAFILASIWPKQISIGPPPTLPSCTSSGYYCVNRGSCEGQILSEFSCPTLFECCSTQVQQPTCSQQNGDLCTSNEYCPSPGSIVGSSDSTNQQICCVGATCQTRTTPPPSQCEQSGGACRTSSCLSNETSTTNYTCQYSGDSCCIQKTSKTSYTWIWILLVLIVLIIAGILFRDKLRNLWFKMKSGAGKPGAAPPGHRPAFPPPHTPYYPRPMRPFSERRILIPQPHSQPRTAARPARSVASKELDEVLRKLKEMGK